ncbi:MAG: ABC transporter ATP-binding protein [Oscillospiraceae bacterium]
MAFLEVRDLEVSYSHVSALNGVSIDVEQGKIVSVIGANGAGKSSLLNTISGMVKPKSGSITLQGENLIMSPDKVVKKGVAQVPEGRKIFDGLTVEENLIMGAVNGLRQAKENFEVAYKLFPILRERKKQQGGTLSGGEQQMLAIARAMMANPQLIMFDEPSMGLAPVIIKQVFKFIREINASGVTVLLIEQNAKQALQSSDYTYVLENGKVTMQGNSRDMIRDPRIVKAYLGE